MIWTKEQAKALTDKALSLSKAEETLVTLTGSDRANLRFARNTATTSGATSGYSLAITARFGKRSGTDDDARSSTTRACSARCGAAEEIARLSPDNPELMPALPPQTYTPVQGVLRRRRECDAGVARGVGRDGDDASKKSDVVSAGFVETQAAIQAVANSKGLFAYDRFTAADYNLTSRTPDGTGSGWASQVVQRAEAARSRGSWRRRRSRRRRSRKNPGGDRAGQVHRGARAGGAGRSARVHDVLRGCAPGRRGTQLLLEEGRRQPHRRADRRREGAHLLGSGASRSRRPCRSTARACRSSDVWSSSRTAC